MDAGLVSDEPPATMKSYIESLIRHALTALAGLGGFLASHQFIDAGDAAAVDAAGASVASGLVVILSAVIGRILLTLVAKYFRHGTGELDKQEGPFGKAGALLLFACAAGALGVLPSCTAVPAVSVAGPGFTGIYSPKSGLFVTADPARLIERASK